MKQLNLYRIWEVMNFITEQEEILNDEGLYPCVLGPHSEYCKMEFEHFLLEYYFHVCEKEISIFNNDPIPYDDYNRTDSSYLPIKILNYNDEQLLQWFNKEVEDYKVSLEKENKRKKESIKHQIDILTKQLKDL